MSCFKYICILLLTTFGNLLQAQNNTPVKQKRLTLMGTIGTSATFYTSNEPIDTRPSHTWNINGNLLAKLDKVSIPAYFVVSQYANSRTAANIQIGISPTYKWATVHLGYRYINFSPLTYENQSFKGVGIELNPGLFRFAAFYGKLNKAIDEDTSRNNFRLPQFSRTAYGIKAGYGSANNYIDLIYFHAKDDSSSSKIITNDPFNRPQENAVVGSSFRLTAFKKLVLKGDVGISGLLQDQRSKTTIVTRYDGLKKLMGNFLPSNEAISASYGTQTSLTYFTGMYSGNLSYRRVQPGYRSMGTPYMLDDIELVSLANSVSVLHGKINVSANLSQQHNDLEKNLPTKLTTGVGNVNINAIVTNHLNLNLNLSGYNIRQKNGNATLADSLRIPDSLNLNQRITQVNFSPGYNITKGNLIHYIVANINYSKMKDNNQATAVFANSSNTSTSLSYTLAFIRQAVSLSLNAVYTKFKQQTSNYTSFGPTAGISAQLLKNRLLTLQANVGCMFNKFSIGDKQQNLSYAVNTSYQAKRHSFGLYANYIHTQPNNAIINAINKTYPYAVASKNLSGGVSYNYSIR